MDIIQIANWHGNQPYKSYNNSKYFTALRYLENATSLCFWWYSFLWICIATILLTTIMEINIWISPCFHANCIVHKSFSETGNMLIIDFLCMAATIHPYAHSNKFFLNAYWLLETVEGPSFWLLEKNNWRLTFAFREGTVVAFSSLND